MTGPLSVARQRFASDDIYGAGASGSYGFPQVRADQRSTGVRGISSLTFKDRTFRFRSNPNHFFWYYTLNTKTDTTYGGRVMQLLSTRIEEFEMEFEAGGGRWEYMRDVLYFMRDILNGQRDGTPCIFEHTSRGYKFKGYLTNFPLEDRWDELVRPFKVTFKVQEDISGVLSTATLNAELRRLREDVGFRRSKYNQPQMGGDGIEGALSAATFTALDILQDKLGSWTQSIDGYTDNPYGGSDTVVPGSTVSFPGLNTLFGGRT
jgi:hypothetical protein